MVPPFCIIFHLTSLFFSYFAHIHLPAIPLLLSCIVHTSPQKNSEIVDNKSPNSVLPHISMEQNCYRQGPDTHLAFYPTLYSHIGVSFPFWISYFFLDSLFQVPHPSWGSLVRIAFHFILDSLLDTAAYTVYLQYSLSSQLQCLWINTNFHPWYLCNPNVQYYLVPNLSHFSQECYYRRVNNPLTLYSAI